MQLKRFMVLGLFGRLRHEVEFPLPKGDGGAPSVVILYGRNGIGKTTILRMLDGLLRLDFNVFRRVPFESCILEFDSGDSLRVVSLGETQLTGLEVSYREATVLLNPRKPGPLTERDASSVSDFRETFFRETEAVTYEFVDTERLQLQRMNEEAVGVEPFEEGWVAGLQAARLRRSRLASRRARRNPKARFLDQPQSLAARVSRFVREAQINYRTFFSTTEPDLFPRIVARLTSDHHPVYEISDLRRRFENIHRGDEANERFGLEPDRWDYGEMMELLERLSKRTGEGGQQALTVLGSYLEQLESRSAERTLVADRLRTFEHLVGEFWRDKTVLIDPRRGLEIRLSSGRLLHESRLSSGEFHLLLLMVAALVTKRRGTVIAIDEPEMSMHIEWQSKLVPALVECASKANPLFIFATHSPDLAASYPEGMVELRQGD